MAMEGLPARHRTRIERILTTTRCLEAKLDQALQHRRTNWRLRQTRRCRSRLPESRRCSRSSRGTHWKDRLSPWLAEKWTSSAASTRQQRSPTRSSRGRSPERDRQRVATRRCLAGDRCRCRSLRPWSTRRKVRYQEHRCNASFGSPSSMNSKARKGAPAIRGKMHARLSWALPSPPRR